MTRFLATSILALALNLTVLAQEHSPTQPSTPRAAPTPAAVADTGGWPKFTSEAGRFSVLIPKIPTEQTKTTQTQNGPYTTHLFIARDAPNVYLVGFVDYDPKFNFNLESELEANRDSFVKGLNAKLLTTHATTIDGYSAIEFVAETNDQIFKSRVYMVGRRPYQIVFGSPPGQEDSVKLYRFFNSFKINPR